MDYGRLWAEAPVPQPHQAAHSAAAHHHLNPLQQQQQQQTLPHSSSYLPSYYPNPNHPSPRPAAKLDNPFSAAGAASALADPYVPNTYAPHGGYEGLHAAAAASYSHSGLGPGATPLSYYYGAGVGDARNLAVKETIRQYGVDPQSYGAQARSSNGLEPTVPSNQNPTHRSNNAIQPASKQAMRKTPKRITEVVQPAYCKVCKIDCNSQEVLKIHKQGKKHKKNLLKLQEAITAKPAKALATTVDKETPVTDKGKALGEQRKKRKVPATEEELEMKKKRVLEGGATANEIKVCPICNVVVNSQQVFNYHITGQKHAALVKKLQSATQVS